MTWFNELFGLAEPKLLSAVHSNFVLSPKHDCIMSLANGRVYQVGSFSTPTVADLRERALQMLSLRAYRRVSLEVDHLLTGDILEWHHNHPFATFQAASQFNCLDFPQQTCTPEDGITHYASVRSQGQSCALACPGGALYRNYFLPVWDEDKQCFQSGQSADLQINNLALLEEALGNREMGYWNVRNGYINVESKDKLLELAERLSSPSAQRLFRDKVQLGWQEDVEAAYEGTLWAGILNMMQHEKDDHPRGNKCREIFLTLLGGGVFGNEISWISDSLLRALKSVRSDLSTISTSSPQKEEEATLLVHICHYSKVNEEVASVVNQ
eukprot:scaffold1046_cov162-Ochromonas_danica.AAC.24